jgi:hypothetical protein
VITAGVPDPEPTQAPAPEPSPAQAETQEQTENNDDMKLTAEALAALGFAPDAEPTPDEISAAIVKLASDQATAAADMATAKEETTAANSRLTVVTGELETLRTTAVDTVLDAAIGEGRITEADRPAWTSALNTSFGSEAAKLKKLMPTLNTGSKLPANLAGQRPGAITDAANAAGRITEAVTAFAADFGPAEIETLTRHLLKLAGFHPMADPEEAASPAEGEPRPPSPLARSWWRGLVQRVAGCWPMSKLFAPSTGWPLERYSVCPFPPDSPSSKPAPPASTPATA